MVVLFIDSIKLLWRTIIDIRDKKIIVLSAINRITPMRSIFSKWVARDHIVRWCLVVKWSLFEMENPPAIRRAGRGIEPESSWW